MDCRDWLKTLWPASYKGVPFYFLSDDEEGGRDQVVHEFPHRDDPFIEDMGEAARYFSGSAYVHGDEVDSLERSLKSALVSRGAGTLVTPLSGPVQVHCQTFKRHHERDRLGYVAFDVKFVREGAAFSFISIPFALNGAFGAADALAAAIVGGFAKTLSIASEPDFVVSAAADGFASSAAMLDVVRTSYRVDPTASAIVRDAISQIVASAPAALAAVKDDDGAAVTTLAQSLVETTRALGEAIPPETAIRAMLDLVDAAPEPIAAGRPVITPPARRALANAAAVARLARFAALTAFCEAVVRRTYAARPDGVTARGEVAEIFDAELSNTFGAETAALYLAIDDLRGRVIEYLSSVINDLAPVVTVETARIMPSLYLAYRLYGDPTRAGEIVARNRVRHPSFVPRVFSAAIKAN